MAYRVGFKYEDKSYFVGDLAVAEVEKLEVELGVQYSQISVLGNMRHKRAFMSALLARDYSSDKVDAILAGMTLDEAERAWMPIKDDMPVAYEDGVPLVEGEPSTPMS